MRITTGQMSFTSWLGNNSRQGRNKLEQRALPLWAKTAEPSDFLEICLEFLIMPPVGPPPVLALPQWGRNLWLLHSHPLPFRLTELISSYHPRASGFFEEDGRSSVAVRIRIATVSNPASFQPIILCSERSLFTVLLMITQFGLRGLDLWCNLSV